MVILILLKIGMLFFMKILHENLKDINPIMQELITPLHLAAQYGHFEMCKYICDNTSLQGGQNKKHDYIFS